MAVEAAIPRQNLQIAFSAGVYDIDAIKLAAYRFADRVSVQIDLIGEDVSCVLTALTSKTDLETIGAHFRNEVIDQDLRKRVAKETESVRNLILSLAFSKTGLQQA
ncbi:MAG TPA: His-Xaa-Ser system protein HxsD [Terriglobales bacterium]|nr:His-Xaa-Ser system protein HxsD [Terriglobales bacterium]